MAPDTIKAARQGLREDEELSIAEGKEIPGLITTIAFPRQDHWEVLLQHEGSLHPEDSHQQGILLEVEMIVDIKQ